MAPEKQMKIFDELIQEMINKRIELINTYRGINERGDDLIVWTIEIAAFKELQKLRLEKKV